MNQSVVLLCQVLQTIQTLAIKFPAKKQPLVKLSLLFCLVLLVLSAVVMLIVSCLILVPFLAISEFYKWITEIRNQNKFIKRVLKI